MTSVWRRIQQSNKKSAKYRFTITPQELLILCSSKWHPQFVCITCMHRRRKVEGRVRRWEGSISDPCRGLIVWPSQTPDPLLFDTTLYCEDELTHQFKDKEWILLVEECTRKGKRKAIAAVNLNMSLFVQSVETVAELKLKLRPLWPELLQCSMQILISSVLISSEEMNNIDIKSEVSSISGGHGVSIAADAVESEQHTSNVRVDNAIVSSYSTNINEISGWKANENEKQVVVSGSSNAIMDLREKFFEHSHENMIETSKSSEVDDEGSGCKEIAKCKAAKVDSRDALEAVEISKESKPSVCEVFEAESIDIGLQTKVDDELQINFGTKALPDVIEGEDLLKWCKRVTVDYPSVKINDFTKSFRSGLAFCAIIHRYRPDLFESFSKLDFTDSLSSHIDNCHKAFRAAALLGVEKTLDAGVVVTLPDRNEIRSFLSELRMRLVDIPAVQRELSVKESDHRLSSLFNLSESETSVMKELEILRRQRERDEAIDLTNIPDEDHTRFSAVTPGSRKIESLTENVRLRPRKFANPFDSDSDSDGANKYVAHLTVVPQTSSTVRSITDNISGNEISISPVVAARHEELMKKRQQIAPVITDSVDAVEREKHREEARRLMNDAASDGMTMIVGGSVPTTAHQSPSDETPLIAPLERVTQRFTGSTSNIRKNNLDVTLDRARRYGSMRGQELVETVAKVAGRALAASLETTKNPVSVTPTRKLISQWEKDGADLGKIQSELSRLSKCLAQVSGEDEIICSQLMKTKVSSEEEERLLQEHMRLLTEKDAIVRRTEYFNVLEQLREVEDQITKLQHELSSASNIDQDCKTEDDKQKIDKMVEDLVAFVNKKDCLSQKLISHEAEDEEIGERDRLTLEAAANFSRGLEQPLSASKRFITWFRSEISS